MDNLTHSLVGALLGQAGLKRRTGLAMPALIVAANLPDIDAGCVVWGVESLAMRRGLTHGPIAWLLLPLLLAAFLWWFDKWQTKRGTRPEGRLPVHFGWLYTLSFIACLTHPALDWLNTYGIRLLEPFSHRWFYGDTLFIIDVWLWGAMGLGVWFSLWREKRGKSWRWPAFVTIVVSLVYVAGNYTISATTPAVYAINEKVIPSEPNGFAQQPRYPHSTMIAAPVPFRFWQRELILGERNDWRVVAPGMLVAPQSAGPITFHRCQGPNQSQLASGGSDLAAFLFWSRAPFAVPREGGGIAVHDARFYSPGTRDRFSVALPDVPCEPTEP